MATGPSKEITMGLLDTYATSAKFGSKGARVAGRVLRTAEVQQRDFDTNEPLFWDDGNKRMQLVVTVDTGDIDPTVEDDDGERAIYVKGQMLQAVKKALRRARTKEILPGGWFAVTWVDEEPLPKGKRGYPKKIYDAEYEPPAERAEDDEKPSHQGSLKDAQKRAAERPAARRDDDEPPF
jgi:hypothetical protein